MDERAGYLATWLRSLKAGMRHGYVQPKVHPALLPADRDLIVEALGRMSVVMRFWDVFVDGHWQGMAEGDGADAARTMYMRCRPGVSATQLRLTKWFGRFDPRNCVTSGGKVPDPVPPTRRPILGPAFYND